MPFSGQLTHEDSVDQNHDPGHNQQLLAGCSGVDVVPVAIVGEEGGHSNQLSRPGGRHSPAAAYWFQVREIDIRV